MVTPFRSVRYVPKVYLAAMAAGFHSVGVAAWGAATWRQATALT